MTTTSELLAPEIHELVRSGRYRELRDALDRLEHADVADILSDMEPDEAAIAFRLLRRDAAGDVLADLESETQEALLAGLSKAAVRAFEQMEPDDRAELLDELPADLAKRLIARLSPSERRYTQQILGYPPESVGRLMTPYYVRVRPEWTVAHAIEHIRTHGQEAETINWVYIIDAQGRLVDDLMLRELILAEPEATVESIMDKDYIALNAADDQETAVSALARYDRTVLPVTDSRGVLLGIVTFDDIADVAEEEATEDIQLLAGMKALDEPYTRTTIAEMTRKRSSVLALLLVCQTMGIPIISTLEDRLPIASLLIFVPMIIACGGNSGTQASALLVRALALDEVTPKEWWLVIRKELMGGLVTGSILGSIAAISIFLWSLSPVLDFDISPLMVGLTIGAAVLANVIWGVTLGSMLPLLLRKIGLDPATISGPLVTTLLDLSGLLIYLAVATTILGTRALVPI